LGIFVAVKSDESGFLSPTIAMQHIPTQDWLGLKVYPWPLSMAFGWALTELPLADVWMLIAICCVW